MILPYACIAWPCEADRAKDSGFCAEHLEESKTYKFKMYVSDSEAGRK
jgi:hypothetical protein